MCRRLPVIVVAAAATAALLAGCAPSPTTTYVDDHGETVTVNWVDYPGHAHTSSDEVLAAPPKEESEAVAKRLFAEVKAALGEFDLRWTVSGESGWYPAEGNGYGGPSAYVTYNSEIHSSDSIPSSASDWGRIIELVSEVTEEHGLGSVELDHESSSFMEDTEWQTETADRYGTDDPDKFWSWFGTAYGNSQWLSISLVDTDRDLTGKAADEYEQFGWEPRSIAVTYGVTTIPRDEIAEFQRALKPFDGLKKPDASRSE